MSKLLIRSYVEWWVNLLVALGVFSIVFTIIGLLPGSHCFSDLFYKLPPKPLGMMIAVMIILPICAIAKLWNIRKVYVYTDRVEVRYPLQPYSNSIITMDDVDAFCVERCLRETRGGKVAYYRVLLIKGHNLWLYVSQENCGNYDDMVSVLKEYFALEQRNVRIRLSVVEDCRVKDGKHIVRQDITDEELAMYRKERDRKRNNGDTEWNYSPNKYIEITGWKNILVIAGVSAVLFGGVKLYFIYNDYITEKLVVIDRATKLSGKTYLAVDSVDVDTLGVLYSQTESWKDEQKVLNQWAFPILGSKNCWATISVNIDKRDHITDEQQRHRLIQIFHEHHTYMYYDNNSFAKIDAKFLSKVVKNKSVFIQLQYNDSEVKMGRLLYNDAEDNLKKKDYDVALSLFKQAFVDGYPRSAISIGHMFFVGEGVKKDVDKSILWHKKAVEQDKYEDTTVDALNELSYAYAAKEHWDEAIAAIDKAIGIRPNDANLYDSKGEHLFMSGDTAQAKAMWKKICELDPGLSYARKNRTKLREFIKSIE